MAGTINVRCACRDVAGPGAELHRGGTHRGGAWAVARAGAGDLHPAGRKPAVVGRGGGRLASVRRDDLPDRAGARRGVQRKAGIRGADGLTRAAGRVYYIETTEYGAESPFGESGGTTLWGESG